MLATVHLGTPAWLAPAAVIAAAALAFVVWNYVRSGWPAGRRCAAGGLKLLAVSLLVLCLIEPLSSNTRLAQGENVFAILVDNSRSMGVRDSGAEPTRGDSLRELLRGGSPWQARLGQDYDVRRYLVDERLRRVDDFTELTFNGQATSLATSLKELARRRRHRPLAGVLLFSDGNFTDALPAEGLDLPRIYPVVVGGEQPPADLSLGPLAVSETNFEDSPVTVQTPVIASGFSGQEIAVELRDESGQVLQRQPHAAPKAGEPLSVRFTLRPDGKGVRFYQVHVAAEGSLAEEATSENNSRWFMVDRGGGPMRVLYVAGRPNWEFKFLRRALEADEQIQLVGLLRIAKREPKFQWRGRDGENSNPLFRGFENEDEPAERYDEPVMVRLGTKNKDELRGGFPKTPEELFGYDAVVLDDVEAAFFTAEQLSLLEEFVRRRGGGLLMLGGAESFRQGKYHRTPVGEMLPVYLDRRAPPATAANAFRLALSREGRLQPWMRLRRSGEEEAERMGEMPAFKTLNRAAETKPGATVLAHAADATGRQWPAVVAQPFGAGRTAAVLLGDLWRWSLRRKDHRKDDLPRAWRQTLRWLVADAPRRLETRVAPVERSCGAVEVVVRVGDKRFQPLDNASVEIHVRSPQGDEWKLPAQPSEKQAGVYSATFTPRKAAAYRARVIAKASDGAEVGRRETGWVCDPVSREFRDLTPNRELLERLAERTGGRVVRAEELDEFVADTPRDEELAMETRVVPLWHQPWVLMLVMVCLAGEWGFRRWKGLP